MNFQAQSALIAGVSNFVLALAVLAKGRDNPSHQAFAQLSIAIFIWNICFFLHKVTGYPLWNRLLFVGVLLMPSCALRFVSAQLPQPPYLYRKIILLSDLGGLILLVSLITPLFEHRGWSFAAIGFIFPFLLIALGILFRYAQTADSIIERRRLRFLGMGGLVAVVSGPTDFLAGLGIPFPQLGTIAILGYMYAVATGILHYHLFDLPEIIGKGIAFLVQIFLLAGILSWLTLGNRPEASLIGALTVTLFFLVMEPLRHKLGWSATRLIQNDFLTFKEILTTSSHQIRQALDTSHLQEIVIRALESLPSTANAQFIIDLTPYRPLLQQDPFILESKKSFTGIKEDCHGLILLPLQGPRGLLGAIKVQQKEGISSYSNREIDAMMILANQTAAAIEILRTRDEIYKKGKLAEIGELAASLAHEIRNPLGAIKGAAQYLRHNPKPEESHAFLEIIQEEVNRLNRVVAQFLDYARPFQKNITPFNLADLLQRIIQREREKNGKVQFRTQIEKDLPWIHADVDQIRQVVDNLVLNAKEAMPEGGEITMEVRTRTPYEIELGIRDTGIGIPEELQDQLMQPFVTTKKEGMGLGLAICKRIIEGHGGTLSVESQLGQGTLWTLRFPIKQTL